VPVHEPAVGSGRIFPPTSGTLGLARWEETTDFAGLRGSMKAVMERRAFIRYAGRCLLAAAAQALKRATSSIPIVVAAAVDLVGSRIVESLRRPGGNVTGLSAIGVDLSPKHLELLRTKNVAAAAETLALKVIPTDARVPNDIEGAYAVASRKEAGASSWPPTPSTRGRDRDWRPRRSSITCRRSVLGRDQSQGRSGSRADHSALAPARRGSGHRAVSGWLGGLLVGLLVAGILPGCSISPAQQDAIRRAWEERDAERARECERMGRGFVAGGCTGGGGP
jgi:ABC transporter substrate binding protein